MGLLVLLRPQLQQCGPIFIQSLSAQCEEPGASIHTSIIIYIYTLTYKYIYLYIWDVFLRNSPNLVQILQDPSLKPPSSQALVWQRLQPAFCSSPRGKDIVIHVLPMAKQGFGALYMGISWGFKRKAYPRSGYTCKAALERLKQHYLPLYIDLYIFHDRDAQMNKLAIVIQREKSSERPGKKISNPFLLIFPGMGALPERRNGISSPLPLP